MFHNGVFVPTLDFFLERKRGRCQLAEGNREEDTLIPGSVTLSVGSRSGRDEERDLYLFFK